MIGFAGLSHLGIISSIATASKGFEVIAYDQRPDLCGDLALERLSVLEPDLPELLSANKARLQFTSDPTALSACDVIYFSLDVSTDQENRSDLSGLRRLIEEVVIYAKPEATLVVLSQVPPGFTRRLCAQFEQLLDQRRIRVFYQVETLIFGRAVERALRPERFIIGCHDPKAELPKPYAELLALFSCPVLQMRYESAELGKISINIFLAASLSATNTLAELCEVIEADWAEIVPTLRLDRRIGPHAYLTPGLGIAGGNIERDLVTVRNLAAEYGTEDGVPSAFLANSRYRREWVLRMLHRFVLGRQTKPMIAVWGLAYKPNTKSVKNSPSLALLEALSGQSVRLYDPSARLGVEYSSVMQTESALEACQGAHALVIMTAWSEFTSIPTRAVKEALARPVVIDPSGVWSQRGVSSEGFTYCTLGRPAQWSSTCSSTLI